MKLALPPSLLLLLSHLQCSSGPSVRGFIDQIEEEPQKIMIVGADCSTSSESIGELAPFWNLVQVRAQRKNFLCVCV